MIRLERLQEQAVRAERTTDYKRAEELLQEALRNSVAIEETPSTVSILINLARLDRLHLHTGNGRNAIDSALLKLTPEMELYPEAAQEKAMIELSGGNHQLALEWARKAAETERGGAAGRRLNLVGRILLLQQRDGEAALLLEKALKLNAAAGSREEEANSLRLLGIIARNAKKPAESTQLLSRALELDKELAASGKIALDLEELALTAESAGSAEGAARYLQRAYLVHFGAARYGRAAAMQERCIRLYEMLNDRTNAEKARLTAKTMAELINGQRSGKSPATTSPSSKP